MKINISWDMDDVSRCIGGRYCLHLQDRNATKEASSKQGRGKTPAIRAKYFVVFPRPTTQTAEQYLNSVTVASFLTPFQFKFHQ
jgi:hypothetical protein